MIGSGGMGDVYLAEDTRLGRSVAIKLLTRTLGEDGDKRERFLREAKMASALNHPNILTVHDVGEDSGRHFIAAELIEGQTLREMLSRSRLDVGEVIDLGIQISEALGAAHKAGIIHRDIKPENVMVRSDGYVKVLDFGLAKPADLFDQEHFATSPGVVLGTVAYMSPEQIRGQKLDARSDVFSLGSLLYEMLTGTQAFVGETASHVLVGILEKEHPPLPPSTTTALSELHSVVARAMSKDPASRQADASSIAAQLVLIRNKLDSHPHDVLVSENTTQALPSPEPANTIAVLPFANMSRDENGDYLSDGLAEELLNVLSKIRGLRVAARTSAFAFKEKKATIAEIGWALNVASILEGSIRTAGRRVRIAVQLIKVSDGYRLWSESYDREMDDIFAVQDDIAQSVVEELRVHLLGEKVGDNTTKKVVDEVASAVRGRADDPEAQRLMLLGRYFLDRTTRDDVAKARKYFEQAIDLDPAFALGWAELGRAIAVQAGKGWIAVEEYASARAATQRALELEPSLAEAHATLGRIQASHDMNVAAARLSYDRALQLAPSNALVIDGASVLELKLCNLERAREMSRQVVLQDPLSAAVWHNLGLICHAIGDLAEAENAMSRALELVQRRTVSAAMLALVIFEQGRAEEAFEALEKEPDAFWRAWAETLMLARASDKQKADAALENLLRQSTAGDEFQLAEVYAVRGDIEAAFSHLEASVAQRDPGVTHAKTSPHLRVLHDDERWNDLLSRIGLAS